MEIKNKRREIIHEAEEKAYSDDGVDLTLIRWMLTLSPAERLNYLQQNVGNIMRLQDAIKRK